MARKEEVRPIFLAVICCLLCVCNGYSPSDMTRSLQTKFICDKTKYPSCNATDDASYPNLIQIKAAGPNDTLYYLLSTIGVPTLFVASTDINATCKINQDHLMKPNHTGLGDDTITFSSEPLYSYAVMFTTVYEYNDRDDLADMGLMPQETNDSSTWKFHHLAGLQWLPSVDISDPDNHIIYLNVTSSNVTTNNETDPFFFNEDKNGSFSLKFQFKTSNDRNDNLPHLEFTANNTQVAVVLDEVDTSFENSRFGMEIVLISEDSPSKQMNLTKTRSIDDEHTPGVFEMIDWTTHGDQFQTSGAYLQWKPVCYKSVARSLNQATKQFYYDLVPLDNDTFPPPARVSLAYAYYGEKLYQNRLSMSAANVSFGLSKDNFYRDTNYTIWTFTIGAGIPPSDQVSIMIIMVISIGLGLPVLLIAFGSVCVCIKKKKERKADDMTSSYSAIN